MEMFLMLLCLSLFGLAVLSIAFAAATNPEQSQSQPSEQPRAVERPEASHFFADPVPAPAGVPAQIPIEALLLQIENHVQLEQAAVECYMETPNADLLHARTISPLVQ